MNKTDISTGISMNSTVASLLIVSNSHLGGKRIVDPMKRYIYGQREDNLNIFDIKKTWAKLVLAARACNGSPNSIVCVSSKIYGRKPVLKFAETVGAKSYTGRFIPGTFTNTNIDNSSEPSIVIVSDPLADKQAIKEASEINCPVIAFCNTDADLKYVDIAIPINNRSPHAIGTGFFLLSRLINFIKGGKDILENIGEVELFFYRDASEIEDLMAEKQKEVEMVFGDENIKEDLDNTDFGKQLSIDNSSIQQSQGWN